MSHLPTVPLRAESRSAPLLRRSFAADPSTEPDDAPMTPALRGVRSLLEALPRDCSGTTCEGNLALIRRLGSPAMAARLLRQCLDDTPMLREIAARSYRHTNHFDKIVLIDTGALLGYRLTLHLWSPPYTDAQVNDEQIHDHRFSFWSTVLVGHMAFQNYVRDASGSLFNEYQYIPEKLQQSTVGNYYIDVGASPLLEAPRSQEGAGGSYFLPYSQIHRVVLPTTHITCTMVLRGPRQKNYASVFSSARKYAPSANTMFTPADLADKLALVVHALKGAPHGRH